MYPDGMGRVFCTEWLLWENPYHTEEEIKDWFWDYYNADLIILPAPPVSPHLDVSAKLVDPETWIVGEWPPTDPNTPVMDEIVTIFESMSASTGNPYAIHRISQPERLPNGYWRTYTNSYQQNGTVLIPVYDVAQDSLAVVCYREALPGYKIVPINCVGFDMSGGAIHCSTHGISWHGDDYLFTGEISMDPVYPPVQIPASGGSFDFTVRLTSAEAETSRMPRCRVPGVNPPPAESRPAAVALSAAASHPVPSR